MAVCSPAAVLASNVVALRAGAVATAGCATLGVLLAAAWGELGIGGIDSSMAAGMISASPPKVTFRRTFLVFLAGASNCKSTSAGEGLVDEELPGCDIMIDKGTSAPTSALRGEGWEPL